MFIDEKRQYKNTDYFIHYDWDAFDMKWQLSALDLLAVLLQEPDYKKVRYQWNKRKKAGLLVEERDYDRYRMKDFTGKMRLTEVVTFEEAKQMFEILALPLPNGFELWFNRFEKSLMKRAEKLPSAKQVFGKMGL